MASRGTWPWSARERTGETPPPNHGCLVGVLVVVIRQVCVAPVLRCFRLLAVGPLLHNDPRAARVNRLAPGLRGL
eukprot:7255269-Pyramimonas_sp.AAC.1